MARGRLLPSSLVRDRRVARLSLEAYAYYQTAIAFLDRDGLLTGDPDLLLADLAPLRRTDIDLKMRQIVQEWLNQGLFVLYGEPDNPVLFCPDFRKHNREMEYTKEAPSAFPPPPNYFRSRYGLIPNDQDLALRLAEDFGPSNLYGYTLAYYAEHGQLPADEKPRKPAKKASETAARPDRAQVETNSRSSRDEDQDQDQEEHGGGGVQTDRQGPTLGYGKGGDARGGPAPTDPTDPTDPNQDRPASARQLTHDSMYAELAEMYMLPPKLLVEAAITLGDEFNIWQEYRGNWRAWLDEMDHDTLLIVLSWLWKWRDAAPEDLGKMHSMIAVLRDLVKQSRRAELRPDQMHELLVYAGVIEEPAEIEVDL